MFNLCQVSSETVHNVLARVPGANVSTHNSRISSCIPRTNKRIPDIITVITVPASNIFVVQ